MAYLPGLYPPIIPDAYPAMLQQGETIHSKKYYKIYFSIPALNSINNIDLRYMQVSIKKQSTNTSVLDKTKYFSEILVTEAQLDSSKTSNDYNYYILIPLTAFQNNKLNINQLYKIQLRFCQKHSSITEPISYTGSDLSVWLNTYNNRFSQWSRVGLIKLISKPTLNINGLNAASNYSIITTSLFEIIGLLTFSNASESETLKSYQIFLKDIDKNILYQSDIVYSNNFNNYNQINHVIPYEMLNNTYYYISIIYTTNNLYEDTIDYKIKTSFTNTNINPLKNFSAIANEENGYIKLIIQSAGVTLYSNNNIKPLELIIKRTSSETKFSIWDDWKIFTYTEKYINKQFYDMTIESGIWYKYGLQMRGTDSNNHIVRTNMITMNEPVMCIFDNMFLTTKNKQLKIKFNPIVNQFKYNILESQQNTLGGQFPYITRNGNNYYRSFSIGGIVSALSETLHENDLYVETSFETINYWEPPHSETALDKDDLWGAPQEDIEYIQDDNSKILLNGNIEKTDSIFDNIELNEQNKNKHKTEIVGSNNATMFSQQNEKFFATNSTIYNQQQELYENYNLNHNITPYQDIIREKEFRKLVFDFLYSNDAKLFRSNQEGNIIIRLTGLTFEPVEGTNRLVYSFSGTAVEIDENNINNYKKYKILQEDKTS